MQRKRILDESLIFIMRINRGNLKRKWKLYLKIIEERLGSQESWNQKQKWYACMFHNAVILMLVKTQVYLAFAQLDMVSEFSGAL